MATAGSIVIDLLMKTGSFETDSKRAEKRLKELQKEAVAAGKAIGAGIAVAGTALAALTIQAINFADEIDEMSARLSISTETLSGWAYAAELSGTSLEALISALPKLSKNLTEALDAGSKQAQMFKALGISVTDADGRLRRVEDVLPELADRFQALDNPTQEAALAMELLGKSGTELLEFLNRGSTGIKDLTDRAAALGIKIGGETASAAAKFNDQLGELKALSIALGLQISERLLPDLIKLTQQISDLVKEGDAAAEIADAIGAGFKVLDGTVRVVTSTVRGITADLIALGNAGQAAWNALTGDWEGAARNMREAATAREMAARESDDIARVFSGEQPSKPQGLFAGVTARSEYISGADQAKLRKFQADLDKLLAGGGGGGRGKGDSKRTPYSLADSLDEDREALQRLLEQEDKAREQFEAWAAQLAGPVADANYQFARDMEQLSDLAKQGAISSDELTRAQENLRKEHERNLEAIQERLEPGRELLKDLQFELDLMKMTNAERATAIQLRGLEADQIAKYGDEIAEANRKLVEQADQIDFMDGWRGEFQDFFSDVLTGTKSIGDAFEDMLSNIGAMIAERMAQNWVDQLFGQMGTTNGGTAGGGQGGWFQAIAAAFSGSRAGGGDVLADRGYWVGEQGPEWFQPRTAGTVLPHEESMQRAGGRSNRPVVITNNMTVQGKIDRQTETQIAREMGIRTQVAMRRNG
jgi:hypothetical protein